MKNLLFILILAVLPKTGFGEIKNYIEIPKPKEMSTAELQDFNIFINNLEALLKSYDRNNFALYQPAFGDGGLIEDHSLERGIGDDVNIRGILNVPDAQKISELHIIAEEVAFRQKPDGKILITKLPVGTLVLAARSLKGWTFVTDGAKSGWIEEKNLKPAPSTVYVMKENKKLSDDTAWMKEALSRWEEFKKIRSLFAQLDQAKPPCPENLTHEELDSLISVDKTSESSLRAELAIKCGASKSYDQWPKAKAVQLKKKDCLCLHGDVLDYKKVVMNTAEAKEALKDLKKFKNCSEGLFYVICFGENGAPPPEVACPKECLSWKK